MKKKYNKKGDWEMIHKIKYHKNEGFSKNMTSNITGIDRKTVRKFWDMPEAEIEKEFERQKSYKKELDKYTEYICFLLTKYPKMKVPKIRRKLKAKGINVKIQDRAFRNFVNALKEKIDIVKKRYYEPIIENIPGVQAQVDLGEMSNIQVGSEHKKIYFAVMVLSYSRSMWIKYSIKPFNTKMFIEFHNECFRRFGGIPDDIVYDQTKLVVIEEKYREVYFNEKFYQYATRIGFNPVVCEGYDPESKGKVESCVKYVKNDFLYGEEFSDFNEIEIKSKEWLEEVAEERIHGTTKRKPRELLEHEKQYLKPYINIEMNFIENEILRKVDNVGMISYSGNKYSVPKEYQKKKVLIEITEKDELKIYDKKTKKEIAKWDLSNEKGRIYKNNNHYRDHKKTVKDRETEILKTIPKEIAEPIFENLKKNNTKIYKDQLVGMKKIIKRYEIKYVIEVLKNLIQRKIKLRATLIEEYVQIEVNKRKENPESIEIKPIKSKNFVSFPLVKQHKLSVFKEI